MNEATGNTPASYAIVSLWYAFDAFETSASEFNQTWHIASCTLIYISHRKMTSKCSSEINTFVNCII